MTVELSTDVHRAVNERTGEQLGNGKTFAFEFKTSEAVFLSFLGGPTRDR